MPRGKYVNHKGRSRHFTSPEELQQEESSEEQSSSSNEEDEDDAAGAAGTSKSNKLNARSKTKKSGGGGGGAAVAADSDDNDDDTSSEEEDRDKRKGVASLIEIENPNRATKKTTQKVKELALNEDEDDEAATPTTKPELTRREREQIEKQKARVRYEKLHAAGKTSEAKADLARLAIIRQQRAEAAAKREAEKKAADAKKGNTTANA